MKFIIVELLYMASNGDYARTQVSAVSLEDAQEEFAKQYPDRRIVSKRVIPFYTLGA